MKGTRKVLAGRYLMALRAVALTGGTIEYWALNHATNTVNHAVPVHYGAKHILLHVDRYCTEQGLPRLTTLVVNKATGEPNPAGMDLIGVSAADVLAEQEKCWEWGRTQIAQYRTYGPDWHAALPPEPEEV